MMMCFFSLSSFAGISTEVIRQRNSKLVSEIIKSLPQQYHKKCPREIMFSYEKALRSSE
jgi:hypothetical protein